MIKVCLNCNYEGHVYGIPTSKGVSAPFCPRCGVNNKLVSHRTTANVRFGAKLLSQISNLTSYIRKRCGTCRAEFLL